MVGMYLDGRRDCGLSSTSLLLSPCQLVLNSLVAAICPCHTRDLLLAMTLAQTSHSLLSHVCMWPQNMQLVGKVAGVQGRV